MLCVASPSQAQRLDVSCEEAIDKSSLPELTLSAVLGAWLRCSMCSSVASNAGTAGVARSFFSGAHTGVALEEPLLLSELSCADGGAEYPVGSIVGAFVVCNP